jgi:hypothetical protein
LIDLTKAPLTIDETATRLYATTPGTAGISEDGGNMAAYYLLLHCLVSMFGASFSAVARTAMALASAGNATAPSSWEIPAVLLMVVTVVLWLAAVWQSSGGQGSEEAKSGSRFVVALCLGWLALSCSERSWSRSSCIRYIRSGISSYVCRLRRFSPRPDWSRCVEAE